MILSRYTIHTFPPGAPQRPDEEQFLLPEKVLQFGTGSLLRGGPDEWINRANKLGLFNGRVVVVEAVPAIAAALEKQDCLYTVQQDGAESSINAAISRVLPAREEWQQVLECAHNPELKLIMSGTGTADFSVVHDNVRQHPPKTFPGQLLAFLHERYKAFGGSSQSGMVVIPTEAVADNGRKLEAAVFELAHLNGLDDGFIEWLECSNQFCNSHLAVAASAPADNSTKAPKNGLAYDDSFFVVVHKKPSWTIEGNEAVKKLVSFAREGQGISIVSRAGINAASETASPIKQISST